MSESIASLVESHIANPAQQPAQPSSIEPRIKRLFMLLHGRYGTAFTSKFATGKLDSVGSDRGTLSAMLVWQSDLRRYADDVVQEAAQRCKDSHPTFPPSLPEFEALCKACMPRQTYAQQQGWKSLPPPQAEEKPVSLDAQADGKDWARRILARNEAGVVIGAYALSSARMALGLQKRMEVSQ